MNENPNVGGLPRVTPDPRLAARIARSLSDEMGAIHTYEFQSTLLEGIDNEASRLFSSIAMDEMRHYRMLSMLIRALGGSPGVNARVSTPRIDLSEDASCRALPVVRRFLAADMRDEVAAISEYRSIAESTADPAVRAVMEEILSDEQRHYRALSDLLGRV